MKRAVIALCVGLGLGMLWWTLRSFDTRVATREKGENTPLSSSAKWLAAPVISSVVQGSTGQSSDRSANPAGIQPLSIDRSHPIQEPAFAAFYRWAEAYHAATESAEKERLLPEGIALAKQRYDDLEDLIQSNPKRALELSIPYPLRQNLPAAVDTWLEKRVDGVGNLHVLAALPEPGAEAQVIPTFRIAQVNGQEYRAFVYGRRLGEPTRNQIPIHGITVNHLLAVSEDPVRVLEPEEAKQAVGTAVPDICAYGEEIHALPNEAIALLSGDQQLWVCGVYHAALLNEELIIAENQDGFGADDTPRIQAASAWTEGEKTMILIRVDFSDLPGEPFTDATGIDLISNVNLFYKENSYNKTGFRLFDEGSDITPTLRMPQMAAYYGTNDYYTQLRSDARAAAKAAGFDLSLFNFDLICFKSVPDWNWAGLGYVGAAGVWLRDSFSTGVAAHELGHNFGLNHANFWDTGGESVIGSGNSVEYGDKFDTMGSAGAGSKHFNARYKNYLNWLPNSNVVTVSTNGLYELSAYDLTNTPGVKALKIARNSRTNYWVEFRQKYTSNKWLMNGVSLRWAQSGAQSTLLLDTTPGSLDGKDDAAIAWGQTFADPDAGIFITAWEPAGTTPEAIRVFVNRGFFSDNVPPTVSLTINTNSVALNQSLDITATANDPNGDLLAYAWDFGDRSVGTNRSAVTHQWSTTGQYLVRCVVSDLKGGLASASAVVNVGKPSTYTLSGRVVAEGRSLALVRVSVSSTQHTITDSDGSFKLTGLTAGSYTLQAKSDGYTFFHPGFTNPLQITNNLQNLDFIGVPLAGQANLNLVTAGALWKYLDDGSDQGSAWYRPDFDDRSWKEGPAQLGYGDADVSTVINYGPDSRNKYITYYFRRSFLVTNLADLAGVTLGVLRDDGAVVYLNGKEIFRSNMPGGAVNYRTLASSAVSGADESAFFETEVNPAWFIAGTNLLAVEVHQSGVTSSDLGFDLRLTASQISQLMTPILYWTYGPDGLVLTWPAALTEWDLFSAPSWEPGTPWTAATGLLVETNGFKVFHASTGQAEQFFLLKHRAE
jgi:hypothetical protein